MKTIPITDLFEWLGYKDLRSVREWCSKNEVLVSKQGIFEFVFETDFKLAFESPFINKLKSKFGDTWEEVYNLYRDGNIPALKELNKATSTPIEFYKSNSKEDSPLIKKIRNYEKKNAA